MDAEERLSGAIRDALGGVFRDAYDTSIALADAEDPFAFASQMLRDDPVSEAALLPSVSAAQVVASFRSGPSFAAQLAAFIAAWTIGERCPLLDQTRAVDGLSVLTSSRDRILALPLASVQDFARRCLLETEEIDSNHTTTFIEAIGGARGLLTCLGFRETTGSRTVAPLTRAQCLASFQQLQSSNEKLTVGARAFTKHCHRSMEGFWGQFRGNDRTKNATALAKLELILDHAVWKNIHSLPHGEATFELRNADGYGARWYIRDQSFRGFLEPHMENGHENRWRH